jgi:hypothetical protein
MTQSAPPALAPRSLVQRITTSQLTVWGAFVVVQLALSLLNLYATGLPLGDVTIVYKFWMDQAIAGGVWVGIDTVWVYPILALLPMIASTLFGPDNFGITWLALVMLLNAVALGFIMGWGRTRGSLIPAWWWVGFLALLGPIALGRIDAITVPFALVGVVALARHPGIATLLFTIATWIKVWPAALIAAALIAFHYRLKVLAAVVIGSAAVMLGALLCGAGPHVLSFITQQTGRGLQIESPVSTIWMWMAAAGFAYVDYDTAILTFQVYGPGAEIAAALMTPLLILAILSVAGLGFVATRRGVVASELFGPLALALTVALIAFNKVGSPQFVSWLAVPIVAGLLGNASGLGPRFRTPATITLVIATLTHTLYPYLYSLLLWVHPIMLIVLTARNVLYFVLLGWALSTILRSITAASMPVLTSDVPR